MWPKSSRTFALPLWPLLRTGGNELWGELLGAGRTAAGNLTDAIRPCRASHVGTRGNGGNQAGEEGEAKQFASGH